MLAHKGVSEACRQLLPRIAYVTELALSICYYELELFFIYRDQILPNLLYAPGGQRSRCLYLGLQYLIPSFRERSQSGVIMANSCVSVIVMMLLEKSTMLTRQIKVKLTGMLSSSIAQWNFFGLLVTDKHALSLIRDFSFFLFSARNTMRTDCLTVFSDFHSSLCQKQEVQKWAIILLFSSEHFIKEFGLLLVFPLEPHQN